MEFAIIGLVIALISPLLRTFCLQRDFSLLSCTFWILLSLSFIANIFAFLGFHRIAGASIINGKYNLVLEILALLAAGAIAGFWGVEYKEAEKDETPFINVVSAFFVLIFYLLFFFICFYIGKSSELHDIPGVSWVIPGIMMLILDVNALVDIWDYRKLSKNS